ncbi:MarR family winged helix-turn-helix transcriptional regulator [Clostridium senegalense]|uniref:MarR family winged helix-turn-helix transcriptional regulator n=1 Tax=Clostridium senegalense TaxID=1465809 RepID=UPI0002882FF9|nr:MarR family transcriptional regulator [Clostridium senegalense]MBU5225724.1 MarR family transcriptional regulator [Clostridium senegalense]
MDKRSFLLKYVAIIYRASQGYIDEALKKYNLSFGTYPFILVLYNNEGISQNILSEYVKVDKSFSARAIKKLIEIGYVQKIVNNEDSRAYKLYLTDNAKAIVPGILNELDGWLNMITDGLEETEKKNAECLLENMYKNVEQFNTKY